MASGNMAPKPAQDSLPKSAKGSVVVSALSSGRNSPHIVGWALKWHLGHQKTFQENYPMQLTSECSVGSEDDTFNALKGQQRKTSIMPNKDTKKQTNQLFHYNYHCIRRKPKRTTKTIFLPKKLERHNLSREESSFKWKHLTFWITRLTILIFPMHPSTGSISRVWTCTRQQLC